MPEELLTSGGSYTKGEMQIGGIGLSITRHYFPGNNTPEGFFSYYQYILGQREAKKIICIKGGPGTGKSTFLKRVGEKLSGSGQNVDFLHCSADEHSLDGILLVDKKIAFIDGTSPHIIDPITPGAVDSIINFGEFWNDKRSPTTKRTSSATTKNARDGISWRIIIWPQQRAFTTIYPALTKTE